MLKNYIGISRDHSGSMSNIKRAAARDYNETISNVKEAAVREGIDTVVSVVKCGVGRINPMVVREATNSSIAVLQPISETQYTTDGGGTPLFDSVGELIDILKAVPDASDPEVSFVVMVITDGLENHSKRWTGTTLGNEIRRLQASDRWTFVFRVPRGGIRELVRLGIPEGNIQEWDQTERGMAVSTQATKQAFTQFYSNLKSGKRSTDKFYTDIANVSPQEIKAALVNVSNQVDFWPVKRSDDIRSFCEGHLRGHSLEKGAAFYQLTKTEKEVQDYKQIAIRDKINGAVYSGAAARDLLGLPHYGTVKVAPGDHGQYDIFIQSTSVNRKLLPGTLVMYWPNAAL
jgi:hypothetical protein